MSHDCIDMCNYAGLLTGNMHLTESAHKLPKELIIPNDRLHLLNSIGQGECGICILLLYSIAIIMFSVNFTYIYTITLRLSNSYIPPALGGGRFTHLCWV